MRFVWICCIAGLGACRPSGQDQPIAMSPAGCYTLAFASWGGPPLLPAPFAGMRAPTYLEVSDSRPIDSLTVPVPAGRFAGQFRGSREDSVAYPAFWKRLGPDTISIHMPFNVVGSGVGMTLRHHGNHFVGDAVVASDVVDGLVGRSPVEARRSSCARAA